MVDIAFRRPSGALHFEEVEGLFNNLATIGRMVELYRSNGRVIEKLLLLSLRGYHPRLAPNEPKMFSEADPSNACWNNPDTNPDYWITTVDQNSTHVHRESRMDKNLFSLHDPIKLNNYNSWFLFFSDIAAHNYVNNRHRYLAPTASTTVTGRTPSGPIVAPQNAWFIPAGVGKSLGLVSGTLDISDKENMMSNREHSMTQDDMLTKSVPFKVEDFPGTTFEDDTLLSNRFDYMGYDFALCQKANYFYAARAIPLLRFVKDLPMDEHGKLVTLFIANPDTDMCLWDSEDELRAAIDAGRVKLTI